jgi:hypothetical protein
MIDQQNKKHTNNDKQKELAIGRSKFNQSQRVKRWSRQLNNYGKFALLQHSPGTLIDPEATDTPDKSLWEPLLDGGQGEKFPVKCALVEPQGDVNTSARLGNNKPSNIPNFGYSMHPNDRGHITDSLSRFPSGEQKTATPFVQTPGPDSSGPRVGKQTNEYDAREGLLPPIIMATGVEIVGRDIEKLRLQNKRRRHTLQQQQAHMSAWTTHTGDTELPPATNLPNMW